MMSLEKFQTWFNQQFFLLLEEKGTAFVSYSNSHSVQNIISYLYSFTEGGKRLRPYMAYVGYVTEGGEYDAFPLCAAIELLHIFCLVHDDIIDRALTRHDVQTIHTKFDTSTAILVGDLLLAWAFECLHTVEEIEPYTVDDVIKEFGVLLSEVIHGQILDVLFVKDNAVTKEMIEQKMLLKTANYSFVRPLRLGMLLAGADEESLEFAKDYATNIGMAFQLQDDIADLEEDIKTGQNSLPAWYVQQKDLSEKQSKELAEQQIDDYFVKAEDALFDYNKTSEEIWHEIIDVLKKI